MKEPAAVRVGKRVGDGDTQSRNVLGGRKNMAIRAFARNEFHREPGDALGASRREDLYDVGVVKAGDRPRLLRERRARARCCHDFDGDVTRERDLPRGINCAHATAAEEPQGLEIGNDGERRDCRSGLRRQLVQFCRYPTQPNRQFILKHETSASLRCRRSSSRT